MDSIVGHFLVCAALLVVAYIWRRRTRDSAISREQVEGALRRLEQGETGVRLEPGLWGAEARFISETNAALAKLDAGTFDWESPEAVNNPLFRALRAKAPQDNNGPATFVGLVEIDRFTVLRHNVGYRLANQIMQKLAERIRQLDTSVELGRIGRTTIEFAFRSSSSATAQLQLLEAVESLEKRLTVEDYVFDLSVTIGFADSSNSSIRDELIDQASAALVAGQVERVKVCFASAELLSRNGHADLQLIRELPAALRSGQISLHYQPKLHARSNTIKSAEALFRWVHPQRGLVPTEDFIRLAEETGTIRDLTEWAIERAVADQAMLAADGFELELFVNVSAQLLADQGFAERALQLAGTAAHRIGFEITETAVIDDPEAALRHLNAFSEAGIHIAIDDYGSGLSSLAYLKQLPADELKIDRLFVSGLTESNRDPLIIRSSIDLAHALDMRVTAEGVDDAMALSLLRVMGCDLLQGYHISPPLPLSEFRAYLSDTAQLERFDPPSGDVDWRSFGNL